MFHIPVQYNPSLCIVEYMARISWQQWMSVISLSSQVVSLIFSAELQLSVTLTVHTGGLSISNCGVRLGSFSSAEWTSVLFFPLNVSRWLRVGLCCISEKTVLCFFIDRHHIVCKIYNVCCSLQNTDFKTVKSHKWCDVYSCMAARGMGSVV